MVRAATFTLGEDQFFCLLNCYFSESGSLVLAFKSYRKMGTVVLSSMRTIFKRGRIGSSYLSQDSDPRITTAVKLSTT